MADGTSRVMATSDPAPPLSEPVAHRYQPPLPPPPPLTATIVRPTQGFRHHITTVRDHSTTQRHPPPPTTSRVCPSSLDSEQRTRTGDVTSLQHSLHIRHFLHSPQLSSASPLPQFYHAAAVAISSQTDVSCIIDRPPQLFLHWAACIDATEGKLLYERSYDYKQVIQTIKWCIFQMGAHPPNSQSDPPPRPPPSPPPASPSPPAPPPSPPKEYGPLPLAETDRQSAAHPI
ncbi:hypothetical protein EIP91_004282 [Steccherinum ochraceum]|uniref:Uncharacterized protein n=1 Tax=Steccherinum ochraceum TaxID=92696 RepID=A0A4R0RPJ0_9APHY|nr:hypothetical protein EIP91_004282 [Steccherinum ochraceum]